MEQTQQVDEEPELFDFLMTSNTVYQSNNIRVTESASNEFTLSESMLFSVQECSPPEDAKVSVCPVSLSDSVGPIRQ